jgi:hypothetical protein
MTFTVYRAFGPISPDSYYGYCESEDLTDTFLEGATRKDPLSTKRGDVRLIEANGGDVSVMETEVLEIFEDEVEAFLCRNDLRARNPDSITGPTMFPGGIAARAAKEHPERMGAIQILVDQRDAKTAREAYQLGRWTLDTIKSLGNKFDKKVIVTDLDKLSPKQFSAKYSI